MPTTPVLSITTDFQEKADEILTRARRASTLSLRSPYVRMVEAEIAELLHVSLEDETPVGVADQWHHSKGALKASVDVLVETSNADETAQWVISATQDAENPYGTQYAPFVILGHRTRGAGPSESWHSRVPARPRPTETNQGWVEAHPYPQHALAAIWDQVEAKLDLMARQIAESTVRYLTEGTGL